MRIALLWCCLVPMYLAGQTVSLEGTWYGALQAGPVKLRLALHLSRGTDGALAATLDSLDQNATGIRASAVTLHGREVDIEFPAIQGSFEGALSGDGNRLSGEWRQGGGTLPLTLERVEKVPEARRPQEPRKPYPYDDEEVSYENKAGGVKLAGTLFLPRGKGPYPAVVLLTGSGPQDRDESIMGHKPFLVLADYLARRGIAVLRADDRGVGGSTGSVQASTEDDFASDALAGIAFLKTRARIDPARIGLLGHSEGGLAGMLAASRSAEAAFLVLMASPGVTGEEIVLKQLQVLQARGGVPDAVAQENLALQRRIFEILKQEKDDAAAIAKLREALGDALEDMPESVREAKYAELRLMTTRWYRGMIAFDPRPVLGKLKIPVLALNGSLDTQVSAEQNLPAIEAALQAGGNKRFTIAALPGLNHLFQKARTGMLDEYREIEETINPAALEKIGGWIAAQTAP